MDIDYKQIGQRIREIRKHKKLSQQELSNLTGYSMVHISHVETGSTKASIEAIIKISSALNCTPNDILCDNMNNAKPVFLNELSEQLDDCNEYETRIISDIVIASKKSLRERSSFFEQ